MLIVTAQLNLNWSCNQSQDSNFCVDQSQGKMALGQAEQHSTLCVHVQLFV